MGRSRSRSRSGSHSSRRSRSSQSRSRSRSRSYSPGHRVHIADLGVASSKREIEKSFEKFGDIDDVWLARNPPCFAFVVFKYKEDASDAVKEMHGAILCGNRVRVSIAHPRTRGKRLLTGQRFEGNMRCYTCGDPGHFSRDCHAMRGFTRYGYSSRRSRSRSREPRRRRPSPSYGRNRRSYTPSPRRSRSRSRSNRRGRAMMDAGGDRRRSGSYARHRNWEDDIVAANLAQ